MTPRQSRRFVFGLLSGDDSCTTETMTDDDAVLAANAAFYQAFAAADFSQMSGIWADDDVSCIHPGWPVLIGRQMILDSYRRILGNPTLEKIEHRNDAVMITGSEGRVFCIEIVGGMALAATNWFKRIEGAWRMVHHQASPIAALAEETVPQPPSKLLN